MVELLNGNVARYLEDFRSAGVPEPHSRLLRTPSNRRVFRTGEACRGGLIVLDGCVRVSRISQTGQEVVLYRVSAGEACAITTACTLGGAVYPADGHTETDVVALALPAPVFRQCIADSEWFRSMVFDHHARRMSELIGRIESIASERIDVRLARCLLGRADGALVKATHGQIAGDICSTREVVSRHLKTFERCGWVRLRRNCVELLDADPLRNILANA